MTSGSYAAVGFESESSAWFMEYQADLATPPPLSHSSISKLDRRHTQDDWERETIARGRGVGVGEEPNHTTARKPGPSVNHAVPSGSNISLGDKSVFFFCRLCLVYSLVSQIKRRIFLLLPPIPLVMNFLLTICNDRKAFFVPMS
jgi:hypothetical protein